MLRWALIFFLISIVAGVLGFSGVAAGSAAIAKTLFFVAISVFVLLLIGGLLIGRSVAGKP